MSLNNTNYLFAGTVALPPGATLDALARPMIYDLHAGLQSAGVFDMTVERLQQCEFETRFGYFVTKPPRNFGGRGGRGGGGMQQQQQPATAEPQRWMAQIGGMLAGQAKRLPQSQFQALMTLPNIGAFLTANDVIEMEFFRCKNALAASVAAEAPKKDGEESNSSVTSAFGIAESETSDIRMNQSNVPGTSFFGTRVTIDRRTLKPQAVVEKERLFAPLDFGVAMAPVDIRVAVAEEKPVAASNADFERNVSEAMEWLMQQPGGLGGGGGGGGMMSSFADSTPKTTTTQAKGQQQQQQQQQQQNATNERRKARRSFAFGDWTVAGGGLRVDLTRVLMDGGARETYECEIEWSPAHALDVLKAHAALIPGASEVLDAFSTSSSSSESAGAAASWSDAADADADAEQRAAAAEEERAQKRYAVRKQFIEACTAALVRSSVALALTLRGDAKPKPKPKPKPVEAPQQQAPAAAAAADSDAPKRRERDE